MWIWILDLWYVFQECFRVALLATASYSTREYCRGGARIAKKPPPPPQILLSCERRKKEGPAFRPWDGGELPLPLTELGLFPISYLRLVYVTYRCGRMGKPIKRGGWAGSVSVGGGGESSQILPLGRLGSTPDIGNVGFTYPPPTG